MMMRPKPPPPLPLMTMSFERLIHIGTARPDDLIRQWRAFGHTHTQTFYIEIVGYFDWVYLTFIDCQTSVTTSIGKRWALFFSTSVGHTMCVERSEEGTCTFGTSVSHLVHLSVCVCVLVAMCLCVVSAFLLVDHLCVCVCVCLKARTHWTDTHTFLADRVKKKRDGHIARSEPSSMDSASSDRWLTSPRKTGNQSSWTIITG